MHFPPPSLEMAVTKLTVDELQTCLSAASSSVQGGFFAYMDYSV